MLIVNLPPLIKHPRVSIHSGEKRSRLLFNNELFLNTSFLKNRT